MSEKNKRLIAMCLIWVNIIECLLYRRFKAIVNQDMERYLKYTPYDHVGYLARNQRRRSFKIN